MSNPAVHYVPADEAVEVHTVTILTEIFETILPRATADLAMAEEAPEGEAVDRFISQTLFAKLVRVFQRDGLKPEDFDTPDSIRQLLSDEVD